jgi:hypothetical protein
MKVSGKVTLKGITIPVPGNVPVVLDGIEVEYEANYSIHELAQELDLIDVIPDKLAGAYRKFLEYEKEFSDGTKSKADTEAETSQEETKDTQKTKTAQTIANAASAIFGGIMNDLIEDDIETSKEASATKE